MASVSEWIAGARPRTLPAAIAPVVAGLGVTVHTGTALSTPAVVRNGLLALLVALALQVGVNYFNDYSDGVRGTDEVRVGPVRLVGQGLAAARQVKMAALASLAVAAIAGLALVLLSGQWILLPIGIAAVLSAYAYTGGSRPYGYIGLGEVFVFVFFGPVAVCGTTLVTGGDIWPIAVVVSIAIGLLTVDILVANNLRDRELDEQSGKHTLAVRLGDERTRRLFATANIIAFVLVAWVGLATSPWALLGMAGAVPAVKASQDVLEHAYGRGLIPVLQMQSLALLLAGLGLGVGFLL
ncbi:MAG: 1,4-dihydroxy-2-naphthoate polyprenyltransferase [Actinobacteria bacterium]|nr:1,4-dihydroxy-2-naphthoate polyprenyltransferase [Actinomycetota bacterium]MCB8998163.1 1,4-dihydroxy-2-naphthoate polyprenyltransferase [Actinomycetota bacterium]MCB9415245.1 1,4-dihydroxy-2-naphthoate polyprenyltransferase [Actinomycetota bacterium]